MIGSPFAMFTLNTTSQYISRSDSTRHEPRDIKSQSLNVLSLANAHNAPSASASNSVLYSVRDIPSHLGVNNPCVSNNNSRDFEAFNSKGALFTLFGSRCSFTYITQISSNFILALRDSFIQDITTWETSS